MLSSTPATECTIHNRTTSIPIDFVLHNSVLCSIEHPSSLSAFSTGLIVYSPVVPPFSLVTGTSRLSWDFPQACIPDLFIALITLSPPIPLIPPQNGTSSVAPPRPKTGLDPTSRTIYLDSTSPPADVGFPSYIPHLPENSALLQTWKPCLNLRADTMPTMNGLSRKGMNDPNLPRRRRLHLLEPPRPPPSSRPRPLPNGATRCT